MKTICGFTDGLPQPIVRYFFALMEGAPLNMNIRTIWNLLVEAIDRQPLWSQPREVKSYPPVLASQVRALVDDEKYEEDLRYVQEQQSALGRYEQMQAELNALSRNQARMDRENRGSESSMRESDRDGALEAVIRERERALEAIIRVVSERERALAIMHRIPQMPRAMRIRNPRTNRCIDVGGETYRSLVRQHGQRVVDGYIAC